ncbi:acyl carrier protein [Candidatus Dependentiae bacterium]|nr:acyl carrier protein [Candidatus Dependentiae bacterium]
MAIDRNETKDKVIDLISEQLNVDKKNINENSTLTDLGADSLDRVEIVMKLEEEFSIEINDDMAQELSTVGQAIDYVNQLRAK